eukprot:TRINITY_DN1585_c0_g1_i7.p1 TRINITY_DN1585_c0_g1~~TRINITY_DN1585_c0_g1_i7.p1  ORF type:complete len:133 (-),score=5.58 TRINITY_DN1585_c0_g1_i7:195-593(-)
MKKGPPVTTSFQAYCGVCQNQLSVFGRRLTIEYWRFRNLLSILVVLMMSIESCSTNPGKRVFMELLIILNAFGGRTHIKDEQVFSEVACELITGSLSLDDLLRPPGNFHLSDCEHIIVEYNPFKNHLLSKTT